MSMRIFFYLPGNSLNDATQHYVDLVEKAFLEKGFQVLIHYDSNFKITTADYVFVINIKDFISVYFKTRSNKIIFWFQGLLSEEHLMMFDKTILRRIKCRGFDFLEKITLRNSFYSFYVSDFMKTYLREKHSFKSTNNMVIPCYNKALNENLFINTPKKKTSFVYAGGLFSWQCFDETISLYKEIENKNENAFFTVLTKQKEEAEKLIQKANIKNYNILYVPLQDLDEELAKHKYGFMLRENNVVNSCATPTKMNTYLAVGLIPIYTDAITAFNDNLYLQPFEIKVDLKLPFINTAENIVQHDALSIDYNQYLNICIANFRGFYDDDYNLNKIKENLIEDRILKVLS